LEQGVETMSRSARHSKILELISEKEIETQEELAEELNKSDFTVTQATVSRDINQLGLIKVAGNKKRYRYAYADGKDHKITNKVINLFRECVLSVKSANNLVVIKTLAGCGAQAGSAVDKLGIPEILGSVAGDDTLLVIVRSQEDVSQVLMQFDEILR
jgi:transcriptional regulator of arginine metabolism